MRFETDVTGLQNSESLAKIADQLHEAAKRGTEEEIERASPEAVGGACGS